MMMKNSHNNSLVLDKILKKLNKPACLVHSLDVNITSARFKSYMGASLKDRISEHDMLEKLAYQSGGFELEYDHGGFGEESLITKVKIQNSRLLLNALNIDIKVDQIKQAVARLNECYLDIPDWAAAKFYLVEEYWKAGKKAFGCLPKDVQRLIDVKRFVSLYELNKIVLQDIRTVSAKMFGDTKKLQSLSSIIALFYKELLPNEFKPRDSIDVLQQLGIYKHPPLLRISGNAIVTLKTSHISIDVAKCRPYLAFPPDGILNIQANTITKYVLFVENLTTFERYAREINDAGIIIYTAGFPSKTWQKQFYDLSKGLNDDISFYHWGDMDVGGYRILCFMGRILDRDIEPWMMVPFNRGVNEARKADKVINVEQLLSVLDKSDIVTMKNLCNTLQDVAKTQSSFPWIEQEFQPIKSPMS